EIGQQAVAQRNGIAAEAGEGLAECPGLLRDTADRAVVTEEGEDRAELRKAYQQLGRRVAPEAAGVEAGEGHARQAKGQAHARGQAKLLPRTHVVAGPDGGVALDPSVPGARQHERPLLWAEARQSLEGRTRHLHTVRVVEGAVWQHGTVRPLRPVDGVKR